MIRRPAAAGAAVALAAMVLTTGCGSRDSGGFNPEHGDFCVLAADLDAKSKGTHGEDPTAIRDPARMRASWETITASATKLLDEAPNEVREDLDVLVSSILEMNDVFKSYNYNLLEMAQVDGLSDQLGRISGNADVAAASQRFRGFMRDNCGEAGS